MSRPPNPPSAEKSPMTAPSVVGLWKEPGSLDSFATYAALPSLHEHRIACRQPRYRRRAQAGEREEGRELLARGRPGWARRRSRLRVDHRLGAPGRALRRV